MRLITEIRSIINKLSKEELLDLLWSYDEYIQDANDEDKYREGWFPVCIAEFYDNDYEFYKD